MLRALRFAKAAGVDALRPHLVGRRGRLWPRPRRAPYTEADWTDVTPPGAGAYIKSKTIAERAARDWVANDGARMEFCSRQSVGGARARCSSDDFWTSIQFVQRLLDGSVPGTPDLGFAVVDVRDLADLHVRALTTPGIDGERFIAAGKFVWMREVADILRARFRPQAAQARDP